jgi:hypothetical protein
MSGSTVKSGLLVVVSVLATLLLMEIAERLLRTPDDGGDGALFGIVLPPFAVVPRGRAEETDRSQPYGDLVADDRKITVGDVAGYHRFDSVLGYTHLENTVSVNGWWRSNEIGARQAGPTSKQTPAGVRRVLLLGESFAHGSGLPTEQGWAAVAEAGDSAMEIVNLAVDGYSVAQAYLRYASLEAELDHDGVWLMFVPNVDLWRDVNTLRTLGEPWKVQAMMPRFVLDSGSLRVARSPYAGASDLVDRNAGGLDPVLRDHLRRYDRFYFPREYERTPVLDHLLTYKVAVAAYGRYARGAIRRSLWEPGSEALEISRAIVQRLHDETASRRRAFVLLVLPTMNDLYRFQDDAGHERRWEALVRFVCDGPWRCVDLAPPLRRIARGDLDTAADGQHFGPRVNRAIAAAVLEATGHPADDQ